MWSNTATIQRDVCINRERVGNLRHPADNTLAKMKLKNEESFLLSISTLDSIDKIKRNIYYNAIFRYEMKRDHPEVERGWLPSHSPDKNPFVYILYYQKVLERKHPSARQL